MQLYWYPIVLALLFGLWTIWAKATGRIGSAKVKPKLNEEVAEQGIAIGPIWLENESGSVVVTGKITRTGVHRDRMWQLADAAKGWIFDYKDRLVRLALMNDAWSLSLAVVNELKADVCDHVIAAGQFKVELTFYNKTDSRAWTELRQMEATTRKAIVENVDDPASHQLQVLRLEQIELATAALGKLFCNPALALLSDLPCDEGDDCRRPRELASTVSVLRHIDEAITRSMCVLRENEDWFSRNKDYEVAVNPRTLTSTATERDLTWMQERLAEGETDSVAELFHEIAEDLPGGDERRSELLHLAHVLTLQASVADAA